MLAMAGLTGAGLAGYLHLSVAVLVAFGIFVLFDTGGTLALVPLLFSDRPGIAVGGHSLFMTFQGMGGLPGSH